VRVLAALVRGTIGGVLFGVIEVVEGRWLVIRVFMIEVYLEWLVGKRHRWSSSVALPLSVEASLSFAERRKGFLPGAGDKPIPNFITGRGVRAVVISSFWIFTRA
jgi:hypothetical protein